MPAANPPPVSYDEIRRRRLAAFADEPEDDDAPPPLEEADGGPALPGSQAKADLMRSRVRAGKSPHQPGDVLHDPARIMDNRRGRNGHPRKLAERKALAVPEPERGAKVITKVIDSCALGGKIRALRLARGESQRETADAAGVTQAALSYLERGARSAVRLDTLLSLADHFGVSLDELAGRVPPG